MVLILVFMIGMNSVSNSCPYPIKEFILNNGLRGYVVNTGKPSSGLLHMFWFRSGSLVDPPGRSGVAHVLEHLIARQDHENKVQQIGGTSNAATSFKYTVYWEQIPGKHIEVVMAQRANALKSVEFSELAVEREKSVVLSERHGMLENNPVAMMYETMRDNLYGSQTYGIPIIGKTIDIQNITPENIANYYDGKYNMPNAFLIFVGNISHQKAFALAKKYYDSSDIRPKITSVSNKKIKSSRFMRLWITPEDTGSGDNLMYARQVLARIMGGNGADGRLYNDLVLKQGIATSIGVTYNPTEPGFYVYGRPIPPTTTAELERKTYNHILNLTQNPPDELELKKAILQLKTEWIFGCDSRLGVGFVVGEGIVSGRSIFKIRHNNLLLDNVDANDVVEAANQLLFNLRSVLGELHPNHQRVIK